MCSRPDKDFRHYSSYYAQIIGYRYNNPQEIFLFSMSTKVTAPIAMQIDDLRIY